MSEEKAPVPEAADAAGSATRPRFPLARILVPLFGIAAGVWLWLGSGWRWDVTPKELLESKPPVGLRTWVGRYVRMSVRRADGKLAPLPSAADTTMLVPVCDPEDASTVVWLRGSLENLSESDAVDVRAYLARRSSARVVHAKVFDNANALILDTTRGRMNVTSVVAVLIALWGAALIYFNLASVRPPAQRHSTGIDRMGIQRRRAP